MGSIRSLVGLYPNWDCLRIWWYDSWVYMSKCVLLAEEKKVKKKCRECLVVQAQWCHWLLHIYSILRNHAKSGIQLLLPSCLHYNSAYSIYDAKTEKWSADTILVWHDWDSKRQRTARPARKGSLIVSCHQNWIWKLTSLAIFWVLDSSSKVSFNVCILCAWNPKFQMIRFLCSAT